MKHIQFNKQGQDVCWMNKSSAPSHGHVTNKMEVHVNIVDIYGNQLH